jgi:hypothetical protein
VRNRQDEYLFVESLIGNQIWKTVDNDSANRWHQVLWCTWPQWPRTWRFEHNIEPAINMREKLIPKAQSAIIVPNRTLEQLLLSVGMNLELHCAYRGDDLRFAPVQYPNQQPGQTHLPLHWRGE